MGINHPFKPFDTLNQTTNNKRVKKGGGNDVISLRDDCVKFNDACRAQIDGAMAIAGGLLDRMQAEGVQHVLYLGFYKVRKKERGGGLWPIPGTD